jgi:hypothetical protein
MDMDMSQMVEMLKQYVGEEELAKKGMDKMDTTIYMKDIIDTVSSLTAEQKALFRPGSVSIKMNLDEKVFKTHMQFPFTSLDNLQKLYTAMNSGSLGNTKLFSGLTGGGEAGGGQSPDLNQFNGVYDIVVKDGNMSKTLNKTKWDKLKNDPQLGQMKQAADMGVEILYTTTLEFPRPVKKIDNPLAKLSDDKKSVTIKYNLIDIFEKPDQFSYHIEY